MLSLIPDDLGYRITESSTYCPTVSLLFLPDYRTNSRSPEIVEFHDFYWHINLRMQCEQLVDHFIITRPEHIAIWSC